MAHLMGQTRQISRTRRTANAACLEGHIVVIVPLTGSLRFSRAAAPGFFGGLEELFRGWMFGVPPGIGSPVNRRALAPGGAAFQPEPAILAAPDSGRVAGELPAAVQTPLFLVQAGPITRGAMTAKQVEFLVVRKRDVGVHFP